MTKLSYRISKGLQRLSSARNRPERKKVPVHLRLERGTVELLDSRSMENGMTRSMFITFLINDYVRREG